MGGEGGSDRGVRASPSDGGRDRLRAASSPPQPDGLRGGARLSAALLAIASAAVVVLAIDLGRGAPHEVAAAASAIRALELSTIAFVPSGRPERHPSLQRFGVPRSAGPSWLGRAPETTGWITTAVPPLPPYRTSPEPDREEGRQP